MRSTGPQSQPGPVSAPGGALGGPLCPRGTLFPSWGGRGKRIFPCRWWFSENAFRRRYGTHGLPQRGRWTLQGRTAPWGHGVPRKAWLCLTTQDRNGTRRPFLTGQRRASESTDSAQSQPGRAATGEPGRTQACRHDPSLSPGPRCSPSTGLEHLLDQGGLARAGSFSIIPSLGCIRG